MGNTQHSEQVAPVATCIPPPQTNQTPTTPPQPNPTKFPLLWLIIVSNLILTLLSIANLGLISSTIAWQVDQKHNVHTYAISWPQTSFDLNVQPANLWASQVYVSLSAAAVGVVVGLSEMCGAWRMRKTTSPLKALLPLHILTLLLSLTALILVFTLTYRTTPHSIRAPIAANTQGTNYPEYTWTLESWAKAVLNLPLANQAVRQDIEARVKVMLAWRWMLVPIFVVEIIACGGTMVAWWREGRKGVGSGRTRVNAGTATGKKSEGRV